MTQVCSKVIFLDFDGPLTNALYQLATGDFNGFNPLVLRILNHICAHSGAKIVCSSTRALDVGQNKSEFMVMFADGGLKFVHIHEDWTCQFSHDMTREDCILQWLAQHPEVTDYVIIDDENVALPNVVKVDETNGILLQDFEKVAKLLAVQLADIFAVAAAIRSTEMNNHDTKIDYKPRTP